MDQICCVSASPTDALWSPGCTWETARCAAGSRAPAWFGAAPGWW